MLHRGHWVPHGTDATGRWAPVEPSLGGVFPKAVWAVPVELAGCQHLCLSVD